MKIRFAVPVASAATAILVLGACSDDGTTTSDEATTTTSGEGTTTTSGEGTTTTSGEGTTLAKGDVTFAGTEGLGGHTMDITAVERDGQVTGEARFSFGTTVDLQCANTDTDGLVILGGEVTAEVGDSAEEGDRVAVVIREGEPDAAVIWYELPLPEGEVPAGSCQEFVDSLPPDELTGENGVVDIVEGDDIETG